MERRKTKNKDKSLLVQVSKKQSGCCTNSNNTNSNNKQTLRQKPQDIDNKNIIKIEKASKNKLKTFKDQEILSSCQKNSKCSLIVKASIQKLNIRDLERTAKHSSQTPNHKNMSSVIRNLKKKSERSTTSNNIDSINKPNILQQALDVDNEKLQKIKRAPKHKLEIFKDQEPISSLICPKKLKYSSIAKASIQKLNIRDFERTAKHSSQTSNHKNMSSVIRNLKKKSERSTTSNNIDSINKPKILQQALDVDNEKLQKIKRVPKHKLKFFKDQEPINSLSCPKKSKYSSIVKASIQKLNIQDLVNTAKYSSQAPKSKDESSGNKILKKKTKRCTNSNNIDSTNKSNLLQQVFDIDSEKLQKMKKAPKHKLEGSTDQEPLSSCPKKSKYSSIAKASIQKLNIRDPESTAKHFFQASKDKNINSVVRILKKKSGHCSNRNNMYSTKKPNPQLQDVNIKKLQTMKKSPKHKLESTVKHFSQTPKNKDESSAIKILKKKFELGTNSNNTNSINKPNFPQQVLDVDSKILQKIKKTRKHKLESSKNLKPISLSCPKKLKISKVKASKKKHKLNAQYFKSTVKHFSQAVNDKGMSSVGRVLKKKLEYTKNDNMHSTNKPNHPQQPLNVDNKKIQKMKTIPKNKLQSSEDPKQIKSLSCSKKLKNSTIVEASKKMQKFKTKSIQTNSKASLIEDNFNKVSTENKTNPSKIVPNMCVKYNKSKINMLKKPEHTLDGFVIEEVPKSIFNDKNNQNKLNFFDKVDQNQSNSIIPQEINIASHFNEQKQIYNFSDQIPNQSEISKKTVNNSKDFFEHILKRKSSFFQYYSNPKNDSFTISPLTCKSPPNFNKKSDQNDSIPIGKEDRIKDNICKEALESSSNIYSLENDVKGQRIVSPTIKSNKDGNISQIKSQGPKDILNINRFNDLKEKPSLKSISHMIKFSEDKATSLLKTDDTDTNFNMEMPQSLKIKSNLNKNTFPQNELNFSRKPYANDEINQKSYQQNDFNKTPVTAKSIQHSKNKDNQIQPEEYINTIAGKISNFKSIENSCKKLKNNSNYTKGEIAGSSKKTDTYENIKRKKNSSKKKEITKPKSLIVMPTKSKKSNLNRKKDKIDKNLSTEQNTFIKKKPKLKVSNQMKLCSPNIFKNPKSMAVKETKKESKNPISVLSRRLFNVNLLWKRDTSLGCECSSAKNLYPFFYDICKNIIDDKIFTLKYTRLYKNKAVHMHEITFSEIDNLKRIVTILKPIIYVKELVSVTSDGIGCIYSVVVQLMKGTNIVGCYVKSHCFTERSSQKILLEMRISNYQEFDQIYYSHVLDPAPGKKLTPKEVISIKISESLLMFPSETIQWTPPGPKVIVEKMETT